MMNAPDMDETSLVDDDVEKTPSRTVETPINSAPSREPGLDYESVFEPSDFIEFLIATDALLEPSDPRASSQASSYVEQLLLPSLRSDPAALARIAKEEPFPTKWSFWLDVTRPHGMSTKAFKRGLHVLGHLNNISSFCFEWNELLRGDTFAMYSNLRLFKDGIRPLWEEPGNKEGGKWVLVFPVDFASEEDAIPDQYIRMFLTLLIYLVCGQIGHDDDICGASMSIRTFGIMVTVWNKDARNNASIEYMKERLQELLMTSEEVRYQDHQGTIKQNEAKRKARTEPVTKPEEPQKPQQKKKPKAMDTSSLGAQKDSAPVAAPVAPVAPASIAVPPPPEKNPWSKAAVAPATEHVAQKSAPQKSATQPQAAPQKPAAPVIAPPPKENPWNKVPAAIPSDTKPEKTGPSKELNEKAEKKAAAPPKGSVGAPAPAGSKATVWGSPLKNYSWADDDETEMIPDKGKFGAAKEEARPEKKEEKKEVKEKKAAEKPEDKKEKVDAKTSEKVAKIPHVTAVKVSPPPKSKFGDGRTDEEGRVLSNEAFFYRQRHKDKKPKSPRSEKHSEHPTETSSQLAQRFDDAMDESDSEEESSPPAPTEPVETPLGFEIKLGARPVTKSFAELAAEKKAAKDKADKEMAEKEAAEKKAAQLAAQAEAPREDISELAEKASNQNPSKPSRKEAAETAKRLEAQKKDAEKAEKAAKAAEKAAKAAEQWKGVDGAVTAFAEPTATKKVEDEGESSSDDEANEARHPMDGPTGESKPRQRRREKKAKRAPPPKPVKETAPPKEKKAQKKPKKSVEERILAVEKAPIDPKMIQMLGGVAVVAVVFVFLVVMLS